MKHNKLPRLAETNIAVGLGVLAVVYWFIVSVFHFFIFSGMDPIKHVLGTGSFELALRLIALCFFAIFSSHVQYAINKRRQAEGNYRTIVESIEDGYCEIDIDGNFTFFNDSLCKIYGFSEKEIVQMSSRQLLGDESAVRDLDSSDNKYKFALQKAKGAKTFDRKIVRKDGSITFLETSISPMKNSKGKTVGYRGLTRDITESMRARELENAKMAAEIANKAKSKFLSTMSHELRTPMNSILGFAQLLRTDTAEPLSQSQKEKIDRVLKSGNHLLELINEVLDLSKIESGKLQISLEDLDIVPIIAEALTTLEPMAQKHNIKINNQAKGSNQYVSADRIRLRQVIINLLSNAIKYNSVDGTVTISTESPKADTIRLNIEDTGAGIAEEDLESLFEPFSRLGAEMSDIEGTGIGLTITRELVGKMGGSIGVESNIGKGTRFYVDFKKSEETLNETGKRESKLDTQDRHKLAGKKTMLYIEDNEDNLILVEGILERRPYIELHTASQAQVGIEFARKHHPDLILMDINLPGMDGYEALEILKNHEETKEIPVVAISANAMPKDIEKGKAASFKDYITKPINVNKFLHVIDTALNEVITPP